MKFSTNDRTHDVLATIVSVCSLILTTATHANLPPAKCPSVSVIIAEKFDNVGPFWGDAWVGAKKSRYDTNNDWLLTYMFVTANNEQEAYKKLTNNVSTLHFEGGPVEMRVKDTWGCLYNGIDDTFALVITPETGDFLSSIPRLMMRHQ